jgi:hypothetical protein
MINLAAAKNNGAPKLSRTPRLPPPMAGAASFPARPASSFAAAAAIFSGARLAKPREANQAHGGFRRPFLPSKNVFTRSFSAKTPLVSPSRVFASLFGLFPCPLVFVSPIRSISSCFNLSPHFLINFQPFLAIAALLTPFRPRLRTALWEGRPVFLKK